MEKIVLSEQTLSDLIRQIESSLLNRHVFREGVITGQEILGDLAEGAGQGADHVARANSRIEAHV